MVSWNSRNNVLGISLVLILTHIVVNPLPSIHSLNNLSNWERAWYDVEALKIPKCLNRLVKILKQPYASSCRLSQGKKFIKRSIRSKTL